MAEVATPQSPGLSPRDLACFGALAAAALLLARTFGSSRFVEQEALQNADYVLTTRDIARLVQHALVLEQLLVCPQLLVTQISTARESYSDPHFLRTCVQTLRGTLTRAYDRVRASCRRIWYQM